MWTAACRADETLRPEPLVRDEYAAGLCGEEGLAAGRALEREGRAHDPIVVRTRVIDERLASALVLDTPTKARAVLVLGAGLDARAFRLAAPSDVRFVEVDHEAVIAFKNERVRAAFPTLVDRVERHGLDLEDAVAVDRLLSSLSSVSLVVVIEGVLTYLSPEGAGSLLRRIAQHDADTRVICDVGGGLFSRLLARRTRVAVASRGAPFRTTVTDARRFFARHGFRVEHDVSLVDWDAESERPRWSIPWTARMIPGYRDIARVIDATRAPSP